MLPTVGRGIFLVHLERSHVARTGDSSSRFADVFLDNHANLFAQKAYTSLLQETVITSVSNPKDVEVNLEEDANLLLRREWSYCLTSPTHLTSQVRARAV